MIRKAEPEDAAAIDAFLTPFAETSMFLRGNLASHGVGQGGHSHSTDYFLWDRAGIHAVFGHTKGGFLMAQCPGLEHAAIAGFARAIAGREVLGITGVPEQVAAILEACGIASEDLSIDAEEPLYRMDLWCLEDPGGDLRAVRDEDVPLLAKWCADYMAETGTLPGGSDPVTTGRDRAERAVGGDVRVFLKENEPVAMASLNAKVAGLVQVGGVYVPPPLRGQGLGGAVAAARLIEARRDGADTAILFAASAEAAWVYERMGFANIGSYQLALLQTPQVIAPVEAAT